MLKFTFDEGSTYLMIHDPPRDGDRKSRDSEVQEAFTSTALSITSRLQTTYLVENLVLRDSENVDMWYWQPVASSAA